jgi:hypothetical protein
MHGKEEKVIGPNRCYPATADSGLSARPVLEDAMRNFPIGSFMALSLALPANATTTRCRDAHGHFTACPPAATAAHAATSTAGITRDRNGRCHAAGGRFVRCPAAAAH